MAAKRMGRPRKKAAVRRYPLLTARVPPETLATFDALAEDAGMTRRELIDVLLKEHLAARPDKERRRIRRKARERMKDDG